MNKFKHYEVDLFFTCYCCHYCWIGKEFIRCPRCNSANLKTIPTTFMGKERRLKNEPSSMD